MLVKDMVNLNFSEKIYFLLIMIGNVVYKTSNQL